MHLVIKALKLLRVQNHVANKFRYRGIFNLTFGD